MSWKNTIPNCVGSADGIFAEHPEDKESARKMLREALAEGATFDEIEEAVRDHLKEKQASAQHVKEQLARVRDLRNYW